MHTNPEKQFPSSSILETLNQLEQQVSAALNSARVSLRQGFKTIDSQHGVSRGGWSQFLDEPGKPPTGTGTAHGVLALLACDEPPDSDIFISATNFLQSCQCKDGGWTKPAFQDKCSLTRVTGLVLRALLDSGIHHSAGSVLGGINWLLSAQNSDGGWGNASKDEHSDVTSTSFALQSLARLTNLQQDTRESIRLGRAWLLQAQNADQSWGFTNDKSGTVAQTSEAIDGLLACGQNAGSLKLSAVWIKKHINDATQFNERYLLPQGPCAGESVIWTQVSKERGLITMLSLGSNPAEESITFATNDILNRHVNGAHWKTDAFKDAQPIWAVKEAAVALRLFQDRVEKDRASVVLTGEIAGLRADLANAQQQINQLLDREAERSFRSRCKAICRFIGKPLIVANVVTVCVLVLYLKLRPNFSQTNYGDIVVGFVTIISFAPTVYRVATALRGDQK